MGSAKTPPRHRREHRATQPRRTLTIHGLSAPRCTRLAPQGRTAPARRTRVKQLSLGVMARSLKENERRLALHPHHLSRIPDDLRDGVYLERGFGASFGLSDAQLEEWVAGVRTREQLINECDVILQPKPMLREIADFRVGQVLWGWPHCVQDAA